MVLAHHLRRAKRCDVSGLRVDILQVPTTLEQGRRREARDGGKAIARDTRAPRHDGRHERFPQLLRIVQLRDLGRPREMRAGDEG